MNNIKQIPNERTRFKMHRIRTHDLAGNSFRFADRNSYRLMNRNRVKVKCIKSKAYNAKIKRILMRKNCGKYFEIFYFSWVTFLKFFCAH